MISYVYSWNPWLNPIAIAVSGGVDSMALAQLCAMLQRNADAFSEHHQFRAMIVDHKAREGSQLEAKTVKERLLCMSTALYTVCDVWN